MSDNLKKITIQRKAREKRTKQRLKERGDRLRLVIFRTAKHIYAQIVDDNDRKTLMSSSTMLKDFKTLDPPVHGIEAAKWVGKDIAGKATANGIKLVSFDRGRFLYHGRVKALAEAARENGLEF